MSAEFSSVSDLVKYAESLRDDRRAQHSMDNDAFNMKVGKINLLHRALYDHGSKPGNTTASETRQNLGLEDDDAPGSAFSPVQRQTLADRYEQLLLTFCLFPD